MKNTEAPVANLFADIPFEKVLNCVHCGLCLESCPTYQELLTEQDSPRGRLYLMRGLWEGEIGLDEHVIAPIARCLGCRACETACPSNVPYGDLLDKTRGVIAQRSKPGLMTRLLRAFVFRRLLVSTFLLRSFSLAARVYGWLGLPWLVTETPLQRLLPVRLVTAHRLMPGFSGSSFKRRYGQPAQAPRSPGKQRRVGLFTGCVMDVAEAEIHHATLSLLHAAGCEVVIPQDQTCCGALPVHAGERQLARGMAVRNRKAFAADALDAVIVNAAGCGAQLHEYEALFSDSPDCSDWSRFRSQVVDILAYLAGIDGFTETIGWREEPVTVLYDAPCHLMHAQGVDLAPRRLLSQVPGLKLVPLQHADRCCGAAGIYNLTQAAMASDILARKLDDIEMTLAQHSEARYLVTGNSGCLFQLRHGVRERNYPLKVLHPAVLLAGRMSLPMQKPGETK